LAEVVATIESGSKPEAMPTPFLGLNDLLGGGLRRQELVLVAAKTAAGKSAFVGQVGIEAARRGYRVLFASLEMGVRSLVLRVLAQQARVFATALRRNVVAEDDKQRIRATVPALGSLPIAFTDRAETLRQIVKMVVRQAETAPIDLLVVDYLQLVRAPRSI